jgi:signal peptidase I
MNTENDLNKESEEQLSSMGKFKKEWPSYIKIIFLVLAFRSVFFEPFKIPSGSMIPTLLIGDFILVNKFSYGFKVPFSDWYSDPIYLGSQDTPERGDVVVFKFPNEPAVNYIKRVVAIPGDTLEIKNKIVHVNGKPYESTKVDDDFYMRDMDEKYKDTLFDFYTNKFEDKEFVTQFDVNNASEQSTDLPEITIPKGKVFVMGDNRDYSYDSRYWGYVPFENIKGRAILIWFSMSIPFPWTPEDDIFKWRPWRIFKPIN